LLGLEGVLLTSLGVGVIGVGAWGKHHVRNFASIELAELVGVCDVREDVARRIGKEYGVEWYSDIEEFLKKEDMEAVSICTPTSTHYELAVKSVLSGKHVLVEKPMTSSLEEAIDLLTHVKEQGVFLMVGFVERFNPGVLKVIDVLRRGIIGEPVMAISKRVGPFWPERVGDVGVIKDVAIHDIDLVHYVFRRPVVSVYATGGCLRHKYEDYVTALLHLDNGLTCVVEANWLTPRKVRELSITGDSGIVKLDYISQKVRVESDEWIMNSKGEWREPLRLELEHFVSSILRNRQPQPSGEDGVRALRVAEAISESLKSKRKASLS